MSLPVDEVLSVLREHVTDSSTLQAITKDLIKTEKEIKEAKAADKTPKAKTRMVALIRGNAELKQLVAAGAFVLSVPDDDTTNTYSGDGLLARLNKAAVSHNEAPRKRRSKNNRKIKTLFDAMTLLKAKTIKASGSTFSIKQKGQPIEVVVVEKEDIIS